MSGIFRVKTTPFTQVANQLAKNKNMSLKAKGLYLLIQCYITAPNFTLSKDFLKSQCLEGERAFKSAWLELKELGYLKQYRIRPEDNNFRYEYDLLDEPDTTTPSLQNVNSKGEVILDKIQNVPSPNYTRSKTDIVQKVPNIYNTNQNNTEIDNTDTNHINRYEDTIKNNISYGALILDEDKGEVEEIKNLIIETLSSTKKHIRINGEDKPLKEVKSQFLKLDIEHIKYILLAMRKNTSKINNIKAYLLTALYNAPNTLNAYFRAEVNNDLYGVKYE
jgi:hypothetical protein